MLLRWYIFAETRNGSLLVQPFERFGAAAEFLRDLKASGYLSDMVPTMHSVPTSARG